MPDPPTAAPEPVVELPSPPPEETQANEPAPVTTTTDLEKDDEDDDEESATVSIATLRASRAAAAQPVGPTVQAVHCPSGHANPPHLDQCRSCSIPITDRTVTVIARPALGSLQFDDGHVELLDAPLVMGRKPKPEQSIGDETARAITLDDPDKLLSRVHAEIRLVDWQVQVLDRESMNHTYVQLPGQVMFQLRPGEPFPIPPGTRITFADVTSCRFSTAIE